MAETSTPRKLRRLRRFLVFLILAPAITVALLPTLLSTAPARFLLVSAANRYLAPGRMNVAALRLSWLGTTEVDGLTLHDAQGNQAVSIARVASEQSLLELLLDHSSLGTVTLNKPAIDIVRRPDGSLNLADLIPHDRQAPSGPARPGAAGPAHVGGLAGVDVTLKVVKGSLRVRAPELSEPLVVDRFDMNVQVPASADPVTLHLKMEKGAESSPAVLNLDGTYDLQAQDPAAADLSLNLLARRWPFGVQVAGSQARGTLDGLLTVARKTGGWELKGDTRFSNLDAGGVVLGGDRLRLDLVTAIWDVVEGAGAGSGPETWAVRRLKLISPVATLAANGPIMGAPGTAATIEGRLDLAALARQLPHALRIRDGLTVERGEAALRVDVRYEADAQTLALGAQLADLVAHDAAKTIALRSPASLAARISRSGTNLKLEQLAITSDFLRTSGSGDLDHGIQVSGALDLGALQAQFRDLVDFGDVALGGRGEYALAYQRSGTSYRGAFRSEFRGLDIRGLTTTPIHRENLRLEANAHGAAAPSGLPQAFTEAKIGLAAGPAGATVILASRDAATTLSLTAGGPLTLSEQIDGTLVAHLKMEGAWRARASSLDIGTLRLLIHPASAAPESSPLDIAVRGRYDRTEGSLTLLPQEGLSAGALRLAGEGLHVTGLGQPAGAGGLKLDAKLLGDLAALDQLLAAFSGAPPHDLAGNWKGNVALQPLADGRIRLTAGVDSLDLTRGAAPGQPRSQEGPVALALNSVYKSAGGELACEELAVVTRYASLQAKGVLADLAGRRQADLQGTLTPNWQTLNPVVAAAVEPGARIQGGGPRPFRIKGALSGATAAELLKGLDAEVGVDLAGAQAYGLRLGATPLVVHCGGGRTFMDPIVTTLNNGKVDLHPEMMLDDPRGLTIRLLPGSAVHDVEINDEVSQKVLSFIAPVLDQATHVHGRVSAGFSRAEFPIGGDADRTMTLLGSIVFNDVAFGAGPLGNELLGLAGKGPDTALRLNQPIQLAIANRRIHQSGLEIPINRETRITVKGSVGFDQTLALRAEVPLSSSMLGRDKLLQGLAAGTSIPVPIGGTLTNPKVDRQALGAAMRELTRSVIKRGGEQEATELLKRLTRDRGILRSR